MKKYELPVDYEKLTPTQRKEVREQYIQEQNGKCAYCKESLDVPPPKRITNKEIDRKLFPPAFFKHPVHLQHCHITGMTEGAVHNYCNAVMWQYEGK